MLAGLPGIPRRAAAAAVLLALAAYPTRVFLAAPTVPFALKAAWIGAVALGSWRPAWGVLLLLAAPLLPIWPYLHPSIPPSLVHLLVLSQALPLLARRAARDAPLRFDAVAWSLVALFCVALASVLVTLSGVWMASVSVREFLGQVNALLYRYPFHRPGPGLANTLVALSTLGDGTLAYLAFRNALPEARRWTALSVFASVALAVAVFGIIQAYTRWGLVAAWLRLDPIIRINATFTDPNAVAAYFAMALPVVVGLAAAARRRRPRVGWLAAALALGTALVFTAGRMGYLASAVGLYVLVVGGLAVGLQRDDPWPFIRLHLRRAVAVASLVLALAAATGTAVATARDLRFGDQSSYVNTVLYTLNLRVPLNERLKGRIAIWKTVGLMVRDHPWFGTGVGTIYMEFPYYNRQVGAFGSAMPLSAHNTFLNVAAELGAVGVASWVLLLGLVGVTSVRGLRHEPDAAVSWRRLGIAAGLCAFGVTMLSGDRTILREDVVGLAVVAALAAAWSPRASPSDSRVGRPAALALVALLAVTFPARALDESRRTDLASVRWGFHLPERDDDTAYEWTTGHAAFHVPASAATLTLPLRALAPFPQVVDVEFDGRLADRIRFVDHEWKTYRYVLPRVLHGRRFHRVELKVSPVWEPDFDGRTLGILVGEVGYR